MPVGETTYYLKLCSDKDTYDIGDTIHFYNCGTSSSYDIVVSGNQSLRLYINDTLISSNFYTESFVNNGYDYVFDNEGEYVVKIEKVGGSQLSYKTITVNEASVGGVLCR